MNASRDHDHTATAGLTEAVTGQDRLLLKWGTIKGWSLKSEAARSAAKAYAETGEHALGAMQQRDTDAQKQALCDLIDAIDGTIQNDWSGDMMTKDEAKEYVLTYGAGR